VDDDTGESAPVRLQYRLKAFVRVSFMQENWHLQVYSQVKLGLKRTFLRFTRRQITVEVEAHLAEGFDNFSGREAA
jgi:hypothetical protein